MEVLFAPWTSAVTFPLSTVVGEHYVPSPIRLWVVRLLTLVPANVFSLTLASRLSVLVVPCRLLVQLVVSRSVGRKQKVSIPSVTCLRLVKNGQTVVSVIKLLVQDAICIWSSRSVPQTVYFLETPLLKSLTRRPTLVVLGTPPSRRIRSRLSALRSVLLVHSATLLKTQTLARLLNRRTLKQGPGTPPSSWAVPCGGAFRDGPYGSNTPGYLADASLPTR